MSRTFQQGSSVFLVILGLALLFGLSACVVIKGAEAPSLPAEDPNSEAIPVSRPLPTTVVIFQPASEGITQQQPTGIRRTNRVITSSPAPTPASGGGPARIGPPPPGFKPKS